MEQYILNSRPARKLLLAYGAAWEEIKVLGAMLDTGFPSKDARFSKLKIVLIFSLVIRKVK